MVREPWTETDLHTGSRTKLFVSALDSLHPPQITNLTYTTLQTFSVQLEQHVTSASNISSWVPFRASDLQLSFTMLDPHVRTALPPVEDSATGEHRVDFMIPDRHGVFKFVIDHKRPG